MIRVFDERRILITGGTGSLGKVLVRRLLSGMSGRPERVVVFSRDEAKQHFMRLHYMQRTSATDEVIFQRAADSLEFRIGDVRDPDSVREALSGIDLVIHAAALKQVPSCEYFPSEAVLTNIQGMENIIRAVRQSGVPRTVVGVSTDKAAKPVNVMGMTKAIQERLVVAANLASPQTRFVCVRYGNVLASRGSVIPMFLDQARAGGPLTITSPEMTRFLLRLEHAVDTIEAAIRDGLAGETFVPRVPAALITNVARAIIGDRPIKTEVVGVRPGEKLHEVLITEEEARRTTTRGSFLAIAPMLPELPASNVRQAALQKEYSSHDDVLDLAGTVDLLRRTGLLGAEANLSGGDEEVLR